MQTIKIAIELASPVPGHLDEQPTDEFGIAELSSPAIQYASQRSTLQTCWLKATLHAEGSGVEWSGCEWV